MTNRYKPTHSDISAIKLLEEAIENIKAGKAAHFEMAPNEFSIILFKQPNSSWVSTISLNAGEVDVNQILSDFSKI